MDKLKQIFRIAGKNFADWGRNPRIYITFFLAFVLCIMLSDQIVSFAQRYETIMQMFEPFIWTFGDKESVMLSSLLLILLFADMPFVSQATPYWLMRTSRKIWLAGQILYVVAATVIYNLFILVVEAVLVAPYAFPGNVWSETAAMMVYAAGEGSISLPISIKTMEISMPFSCAGRVFLLMLLYSLFIASVMLFLNLLRGTAWGVMGAIFVNLYGFLLNPLLFKKIFHLTGNLEYQANLWCGWLSPLNHATFPMHSFGYDYLPGIWVSTVLFLILIVILCLASGRRMRSYNFSFSQEDE